MKTLSRRTVLGAVPALAAVPLLVAVPALAGQNVGALQRLEVSPRLAELIKHYHWCKAQSRRLSDKLNNRPRPDGYRVEVEYFQDQLFDLKGNLADEISVTRAETFADLQAQFDIWFDYYCERNLDGSISGVCNMISPEGDPVLVFLRRLPSEISRLAGVS